MTSFGFYILAGLGMGVSPEGVEAVDGGFRNVEWPRWNDKG